jgi:hypothetical protein
MNTTKVHCAYCAQEIEVSHSGNVMPHRVGKRVCIGSGFRAYQMSGLSKSLREIMPGASLAESFKAKNK